MMPLMPQAAPGEGLPPELLEMMLAEGGGAPPVGPPGGGEEIPPELLAMLMGGGGEAGGPPMMPPGGPPVMPEGPPMMDEAGSADPQEHLRIAIEHAQAALTLEPDDEDSEKLSRAIQVLYGILSGRQKEQDSLMGGSNLKALRRASA